MHFYSNEVDRLVFVEVSGNDNVRRSDRSNQEERLEMRSNCLLKCEEIYTIINWFEAEIGYLNQGSGGQQRPRLIRDFIRENSN